MAPLDFFPQTAMTSAADGTGLVLLRKEGMGRGTIPPSFFIETDLVASHLQAIQERLEEAERIIAAQQEHISLLETLSTTDELTGLCNRRGFIAHFRRELAHAQRDDDASGVVAFIDLDGFKAINDTWGHEAGDTCLRRVGRLLSAHVREQDVVARLGGDEFAVLLTCTTPERGKARLEALAALVNGETASWQGHALPLHLSLGTCAYGVGDREEPVLRHADSRMYAEKSQRRQRRAH